MSGDRVRIRVWIRLRGTVRPKSGSGIGSVSGQRFDSGLSLM